jgi:hypothetical protein
VVFSGPPVSSTNKTDHHDITEILLKVVLSTIKQTNKQTIRVCFAGISIMLTFFLQDCYRLDVLKNLTLIDSYLLKKGRYLIGFLKINSSDDPDFLLKRPKCPVMYFY